MEQLVNLLIEILSNVVDSSKSAADLPSDVIVSLMCLVTLEIPRSATLEENSPLLSLCGLEYQRFSEGFKLLCSLTY